MSTMYMMDMIEYLILFVMFIGVDHHVMIHVCCISVFVLIFSLLAVFFVFFRKCDHSVFFFSCFVLIYFFFKCYCCCCCCFAARPTTLPTVKPVTVTPRPTGWPTPNPTRMYILCTMYINA